MKKRIVKSPVFGENDVPVVGSACDGACVIDAGVEDRLAAYASDFELWARECVRIVDKVSCRVIPFVLNRAQRRVLGVMESQRRAGKPIRLILLKARQWGGSTLVQVYMAWMQLVHRVGWNSVICAHVKDASAGIRGMYSRLLREYPPELKLGAAKDWDLCPYERSSSTLYIPARDCQLALATSLAPNSVRGSNFAMAHLSEVAFWGDGDERLASQIVRTISGSVPLHSDTLIVMESTANGRDNFFYKEWMRAVAGESDKVPVFVPWHEIEIYSRAVSPDERDALLGMLDDYERALLERGVAIESVAWYHDKRREYPTHEEMMAEFPSTPEEAFASVCGGVFESSDKARVVPREVGEGLPERLGVVIPGHGRRKGRLTIFGRGHRSVCALEDIDLPGRPCDALNFLAECSCREPRMHLLIVDIPVAGEPSHAHWLARAGDRAGLKVEYDGRGHPVLSLSGADLSMGVDVLLHAMGDGSYVESEGCPDVGVCDFRLSAPHRLPGVCTRVAAAWYCLRPDPGVPVCFDDLMPAYGSWPAAGCMLQSDRYLRGVREP